MLPRVAAAARRVAPRSLLTQRSFGAAAGGGHGHGHGDAHHAGGAHDAHLSAGAQRYEAVTPALWGKVVVRCERQRMGG